MFLPYYVVLSCNCKYCGNQSGLTKWHIGKEVLHYPGYRFLDTLAASRRHFGHRLPNHQLQTVAAACGYSLLKHHHALADAEACAAIALKLL